MGKLSTLSIQQHKSLFTAIIFCLLIIWVLFLRIPTVQQPFENDSGATAYHARLVSRGEPLYGEHHPAHHMPGAYYTYALAFTLLGDDVTSVKTILLIFTAVTVCLLYLLGKLADGPAVGLLTAIFAAMLLSHVRLAGTTSRIETFVVLPMVSTVLLLLTILENKNHKSWWFIFVGFFGGLTFLFKVNYVSPLLLTGIALAHMLWPQWRSVDQWRAVIGRGLWVTFGFLLAVLPVVAYFAVLGLGDGFLDVFRLGFGYTQVTREELQSVVFIIVYPLALFGSNNVILLISSLTGIIFLLMDNFKYYRRQISPKPSVMLNYIAIWFGLGFIETGISRVYLNHYYLVMVPSVSLLSAWFLVRIYRDVQQKTASSRRAIIIFAVLVGGVFLVSGRLHKDLYTHYYLNYLRGQESYFDVLDAGMPPDLGSSMQRLQEIADYINENTEESDTLYYWSNLMELYYLADRRAPIGIIWPIYVAARGSETRIFTAEYILIDPGGKPLGYSEELPKWLQDGLTEYYELETILYTQEIYRRKDSTNN